MMDWKRFSVIASIVLSYFLFCTVLSDEVHLDVVETNSKVQIDTNNRDERSRIRRAIMTNVTRREMCSTSSQCTGNQTVFDTTSNHYNCYCDNACYETFKDCCPDFVKTCGPQQETRENLQTSWKCVKPHDSTLTRKNCHLFGPTGIWMVWNCPESWPTDETRTKCENASEKFSYPVEDFLPVVGKNGFTFRNKHCAVCNGIKNYAAWEILVIQLFNYKTPPRDYSIDEKLQFALANGGYIVRIGPAWEQPRRYCAGIKYKDSCSNKTHPANGQCKNGPVETVSNLEIYYKNEYCAFCNGDDIGKGDWSYRSFEECDEGVVPEEFSIVFGKDRNIKIEYHVTKQNCAQGWVYDDNLHYCREGLVTTAEDSLSDLFLVVLWFEEGSVKIPKLPFNPLTNQTFEPIPNINNITVHLKRALIKNFSLKSNQITEVKLHRQNLRSTFLVATFRLQLTPYQQLILANQNNASHLNISTTSQKFLELLKFTTNFTLKSGTYRFPVVELVSRKLACFQGRMLQPHEYEVDAISGNIFENTSGKVFSRNEYTFLKIGENITICRKLLLSGCNDGAFVTLNTSEYFIHQNLTIFHYGTNKSFNFGDYQIIEDSSSIYQSGLSSLQNTSLLENATIAICLPFRGIFNITEDVTKSETTQTSYALKILTLVGFTISALFLLFLLITYGIFTNLRTLPGLNLMSLAISMLLSHLIWLIGTAFFQDTKTCHVLGIIEHYLFLVAFMAMSVISYHSCVVFSRPFIGVSSKSLAQFAKYSVIVWLTPAIFIAVCISLDQTKVIFDVYDNTCWLSTDKAVLYLFLLPAAVLLLFNICTFIKTALALSCYNKDSHLLNKDRKQNLIFCTKLATLVGFPWLFAFLGVFFPDVDVFQYLFVIFACFQGFYVAVAFVCNKKTLRLYKKLRKNDVGTVSAPRNQTFQMS